MNVVDDTSLLEVAAAVWLMSEDAFDEQLQRLDLIEKPSLTPGVKNQKGQENEDQL